MRYSNAIARHQCFLMLRPIGMMGNIWYDQALAEWRAGITPVDPLTGDVEVLKTRAREPGAEVAMGAGYGLTRVAPKPDWE